MGRVTQTQNLSSTLKGPSSAKQWTKLFRAMRYVFLVFPVQLFPPHALKGICWAEKRQAANKLLPPHRFNPWLTINVSFPIGIKGDNIARGGQGSSASFPPKEQRGF
jgi:hypothetical protein